MDTFSSDKRQGWLFNSYTRDQEKEQVCHFLKNNKNKTTPNSYPLTAHPEENTLLRMKVG